MIQSMYLTSDSIIIITKRETKRSSTNGYAHFIHSVGMDAIVLIETDCKWLAV